MCEDLDALDQSASNTGSGQQVGSSVQSCPQWKVTVTVRSTVESWTESGLRADVWVRPLAAATGVWVGRLDPEIVTIAE